MPDSEWTVAPRSFSFARPAVALLPWGQVQDSGATDQTPDRAKGCIGRLIVHVRQRSWPSARSAQRQSAISRAHGSGGGYATSVSAVAEDERPW